MSKNYRETLSIINPQSNPDSRQYRVRTSKVRRGHGAGGVRPTSSIFTRHSQHGGRSFEKWHSKENGHSLSQKAAQAGKSYNSYSVIRKLPPNRAASPFHRAGLSQVWGNYVSKEVNAPKSVSPKMNGGRLVWKSFYSPFAPSRMGRHWSTSLPTPRGHYSGYKETNELPAVGPQSTSRGIQSSKFPSFTSRPVPPGASISNSLDASVIKRNQRPQKLMSSITDFSQGLDPVSGSETPRHNNVQSYLFKDSQASVNAGEGDGREASSGTAATLPRQRPSGSQLYSRLTDFNSKQLDRKDPAEQDSTSLLYPHSSVAQYGGQTPHFIKRQPTSSIYPPLRVTAQPPTRVSLHLVSVKDKNMEGFVSPPHTHEDSAVIGRVYTTTRKPIGEYKQGGSTGSAFKEFKKPVWRAVTKPSALSSKNSQQDTYDKLKDRYFKRAKMYPALSPKYSFIRRAASGTTTIPTTPTDYSPPPPGTFAVSQIPTVSAPRSFTSGSEDIQSRLPESNAGTERAPKHQQAMIYKRVYGLKGFGAQPLEGAKTVVGEPGPSATLQQGFESFILRNLQTWQPRSIRIHTWFNRTGETEPGSSNVSTVGPNERSGEDFKPLLKTESVIGFTPDKVNSKLYNFLRFQNTTARNKTHWNYAESDPAAASPPHRASSGYLRSVAGLRDEPSPTSEPGAPGKNRPAAMKAIELNTPTSSTVMDKDTNSIKLNEASFIGNAAAIVRLPKHPPGVKAVTYTDILGGASFSGVRAASQTATTWPDKDYFPNMATTTKHEGRVTHWTLNSDNGVQSGENTSRHPEANSENETEDFSGKEEDNELKTLDSFLDSEGSGNGGFDLPDVLSADSGRAAPGEELSELDYLRISTGNISFKSMKLSHPDVKMLQQFQ